MRLYLSDDERALEGVALGGRAAEAGEDPADRQQFLQLPAITPLPPATVIRSLAQLEEVSAFHDGPSEALLGTVADDPNDAAGSWIKRLWMDDVTEKPTLGATEVWELYNATVDAHPMPIHEVRLRSGQPPRHRRNRPGVSDHDAKAATLSRAVAAAHVTLHPGPRHRPSRHGDLRTAEGTFAVRGGTIGLYGRRITTSTLAHMVVDQGLELLSEEAARQLLGEREVGRVGITIGTLPAVFPVNYRMIDGAIVFWTAPGTKMSAAMEGAVVAFEVDDYQLADRSGWSVLAVGRADVVADQAIVAKVRATRLQPFVDGGRDTLVRIEPTFISGRRLVHGDLSR